MNRVGQVLVLSFLITVLGQSCSSTHNPESHRISSKVVYSLMVKDGHGVESSFSDELRTKLKGDMVVKAISAVEKQKGELEGIEYIKSDGSHIFYDIHLKNGKSTLKLVFNKADKLEEIWVDKIALTQI